jgi:large subunit ribosomal protein L34e
MKRSDFRKKALYRKTPSGKTARLTKKKKPKPSTCALCDSRLHATPKASRSAVRKLSHTQRRPERMFGGVLCGNCTQHLVKTKARVKGGAMAENDVPIKERKFLNQVR